MIKSKIQMRVTNSVKEQEAKHNGASDFQAKLISSRIQNGVSTSEILHTSMDAIDASTMKDIDKASTRIVKALRRGENIALICDYSPSSLACAAILDKSLVDFFEFDGTCIRTYVGNASKSSRGLNSELFDKVISNDPKPTLLIGLGLSHIDSKSLAKHKNTAKKEGVIFDFIWCGNNKTQSARVKNIYAMINPQQEDCLFEDKLLSNTSMTILLASRIRKKLIDGRILSEPPRMGTIVPIAACCEIQQSGSLLSPTNRSIIKQGFHLMMNPKLDIWRAYRKTYLTPHQPITSREISENIISDIEAHARLGQSALDVVKFFRADTAIEAMRYLKILKNKPTARDKLEESLIKTASYSAKQQINEGCSSLLIYLPLGTDALHQKIAETILKKFNHPTCISIPCEYDFISVELDELQELGCSPFSGMKAKENIQIKKTKKVIDLLTQKGIDCSNVLDFMLVVTKDKKIAAPTFELYTLEPYSYLCSLNYKEAASLSPKNVFQGIKQDIYKFQSTKGEVIFDLSKRNTPNLYINKVSSARAIVFNYKDVEATSLDHLNTKTKYTQNDEFVSFEYKMSEFDLISNDVEKAWTEALSANDTYVGEDIYYDSVVPNNGFTFTLMDEIKEMEPYGKGFEYPRLMAKAKCYGFSKKGSDLHLKMELNNTPFSAIWEGFYNTLWVNRFKEHTETTIVFEPKDIYKDNKRFLQPSIITIRQ